MKIYKFIGKNYVIEALALKRLKVSKPTGTNDPFELSPFKFESTEQRDHYQRVLKAHTRNKGFVSFSKNYTSPSMWANYADNHQGACFGFEAVSVECFTKKPNRYLTEIDYVSEFREFNSDALGSKNLADLKSEFEYAMSTKSVHWEYEEEYRAFTGDFSEDTTGVISFLPFSQRLKLTEVILGWKAQLDPIAICELVESCDVDFLRAEPSTNCFSMIKKRL